MRWHNLTKEELIRELQYQVNRSHGAVTFTQDQVQHLIEWLQGFLGADEEISALEEENERLGDRISDLEDELENVQ